MGTTTLEEKPRRHYNTATILHCCSASWGSTGYGYGASIIATTIGQPSFLHAMELDTAPNADALLGAANALFFVGGFFGAILVPAFADKYGRKPVMTTGSLIMLISTAVLAGAVNIGMFIAFRFLAGLGGYMALTAVPLYITEIVPPKHRGVLADINPIFINIGYVVASWVGVGFYHFDNANSWRAPIALGCLPCILSLACIWFIPESPRYHLLRDQPDKAWNIVKTIHTWHGDETFAREEFQQMNQQIRFERQHESSYINLLRRPSYRKRVLMTLLLVFTSISSGVLVINNYATIIYGSIGYGVGDQLYLQAGWQVASFAFNFLAPLWVDRMSRPLLIVIGIFGCCLSVILEAAMVATFGDSTNKAGLGACVAFNYLFIFFYAGFLDGPTWWYAGEIFPTNIRAHGMTIAMATYAVTNIIWLQAAPSAFANIGWRYCIFFIILTFIGGIIVWLTFPDTLNKPLEEVAAMFGDEDLVDAYQEQDSTQVRGKQTEDGVSLHMQEYTDTSK